MDLTILLLTLIIVYFIYIYLNKIIKVNKYFVKSGIPHIKPVPIFGNFTASTFRITHFSEVIQDIYNCSPEAKYVGLFQFMQPVILIKDLDLIKQVTIKDADNFEDHAGGIDPELDPLMGNNLFSMKGDEWKQARNILTPAFTSSKMKSMFDLMIPCAENFIHYIENLPEQEKKLINTKDLFTKYTNDVIATCAFGISVDSINNPKNDFYRHGQKSANFEGIIALKFTLSLLIPRIIKFLGIRLISEDTRAFFQNVVEETIKMRDERGITRPDMIQLMMDARDKQNGKYKIDIEQMTSQAFGFFFGGFDSVSNQMCLMIHEIALNPEVHEKLQQEIDQVLEQLPPGKTVSYDVINSMPYLDAVFNETMRRHPLVPWLDRLCKKSYELPPALPGLKPYVLKPGETIFVSAAGVQMDSKYYENPEKFNPSRFLNKRVTINDVTFLGFGIGPRSCIGNRFAILESKVVIFYIMSKFNIVKSAKTTDPFVYSKGSIALKPTDGFWVRFENRH